MLGLLMTITLHTVCLFIFEFSYIILKVIQCFYVPIKSPNLDSNGFFRCHFTFDADVKGKKRLLL